MLIPVVNNEFYPRWFLLDLLCLHSSVLCKNPVTSLYLAGVSPNFLIFYCIKSLMLDLKITFRFYTTSPVCISLSFHPMLCPPAPLPTCPRDPFHADEGDPECLQHLISFLGFLSPELSPFVFSLLFLLPFFRSWIVLFNSITCLVVISCNFLREFVLPL